MLRRIFLIALTSLLSVSLVTGCGGIEKIKQFNAENRLKAHAEVRTVDKDMVDAVYSLSTDGMQESIPDSLTSAGFSFHRINNNEIVFKKKIFSDQNMMMMEGKMGRYQYDAEGDALANLFIETVKNRGNTVKVYRPSTTQKINSIFKQPFSPMKGSAQWYGKDNVLIEYENDRPKSILVRAHQAQTTIGVNSYMYSTITIGKPSMQHFESNIGNNTLNNDLITEIK